LYFGDVCEVVYAKKQFSYRNNYKAGKPLKISFKKHEEETYAKVSTIAKQAILGASKSVVKPSTLWYHTKQVRPKWNYSKIEVDTKIGNHVFYSTKGT
jgi:spore germination cell wall hydrolase CwlJ-like protein